MPVVRSHFMFFFFFFLLTSFYGIVVAQLTHYVGLNLLLHLLAAKGAVFVLLSLFVNRLVFLFVCHRRCLSLLFRQAIELQQFLVIEIEIQPAVGFVILIV